MAGARVDAHSDASAGPPGRSPVVARLGQGSAATARKDVMDPLEVEPTPTRRVRRPRGWRATALGVAAGVVVAVVAVAVVGLTRAPPAPRVALPLRPVAEVALPGDSSRFDYASLDPGRGLLFIAHLGASEIIEVNIHTHEVVRTIGDVAAVHGVLVVPELHRVYATATGHNEVLALDEDTGALLTRSPTGSYPDGLAYDPRRGEIWTTNEAGGTETVTNAATGTVRGTVILGGEAGNVAYDPGTDQVLVAVQGRGDLAVIDPTTLTVTRRIGLPGCDHDHGLALDPTTQLAFLACDANATLLTVDLTTGGVTGSTPVGDTPDVLAYDQGAHTLYVAAESGTVTVADLHDHQLVVTGSDHLADNAHVVAIDPTTHHSYFPIPADTNGHPALLEQQPTT
jgi:DNA-binding beta-propeller fold protein YncE